MISFRYQLEKKVPKILPGGITRGASVTDFPASVGIAGVSMRLDPGGLRELHWHANAAEWGYVVKGSCRTTLLHPDGSSYIDTFDPGDVWYFPRGYGHSIQGISDEECHFILIFDNGDFSEDHTFSITDFVSCTPADIVAQNLGISIEEVNMLPKKEVYFALGKVPDDHSFISAKSDEPDLTSVHRYPLEAQEPRRVPGGGTQKTVTCKEFPVSRTMAGSVLEIQPGGLREMHWHPNADEWQYYIQGKAQMGIFLAQGNNVTEQFEAGDVGYVPMGAGHYIKNTGEEVLKILIGFNDGDYQALDISDWLRTNPKSLLETNFKVGEEIINKFPADHKFMIPPAK
ncbi:MAG: cupin domain-containing protein [Bacteroidetes bacterium]|nr:cupin domain-containing protein [Bacteroidota bacterium]